MLIINEQAEHKLAEIMQLAINEGCTGDFLTQMERLNKMSEGSKTRVSVFADWADYSLAFTVEKIGSQGDWQPVYNGGLIYDGPAQTSDNFSVNLTSNEGQHRWSIHT